MSRERCERSAGPNGTEVKPKLLGLDMEASGRHVVKVLFAQRSLDQLL